MTNAVEIVAALPASFSDADRARIRELITQGGEVSGAALATNISNARVLVGLRKDRIIRGVAVLKRPQITYRKKIADRSDFPLPADKYPYELGYVFVEPALRGCGWSHRLLAEALEHRDGTAVFATARADNAPMLATLGSAGFEMVGRPYAGRDKRTIRLLVSVL